MTHDLRSMTASEVAKVAESLSEAQGILVKHWGDWETTAALLPVRATPELARSLDALGVTALSKPPRRGRSLTFLGEALRDYLRRTGQ